MGVPTLTYSPCRHRRTDRRALTAGHLGPPDDETCRAGGTHSSDAGLLRGHREHTKLVHLSTGTRRDRCGGVCEMTLAEPVLPSIDSIEDLWWVAYLRKEQTTDTAAILIDELANMGYETVGLYESPPFFRFTLRNRVGRYFELCNASDDSAPFFFVGTVAEQFLPPSSREARLLADEFLEIGRVLYHSMKPIYVSAENMNTYVEIEDLLSGNLTHVFWAQIWGPACVDALGSALLRGAPGWRNENLGDGGVPYALSASPYLYLGPRQRWQDAREYFARHLTGTIDWSDSVGP